MKRYVSVFITVLVVVAVFPGCSGIVQNMQSTDQKEIGQAPFYQDFQDATLQTDHIAIYPVGVAYDDNSDWFRPSLSSLADAMNDYVFVQKGYKKYEPAAWRQKGAPGISFGDPVTLMQPGEDDLPRYESMHMVLLVKHPSKAWQQDWMTAPADRPDYTLVLQVGLSSYKVSQKDWKGNKEIRLGSDYTVPVPWLTSMSDPVPVVHVTGALLSAEGEILRAGAEGFFVKRVSFMKSLLGFGEWIDESDVAFILNDHIRTDLVGHPLAWHVAVDNMIAYLADMPG